MNKYAWLIAGILASGVALAQDEEAEEAEAGPHSLSATMTVTSDYVFRGVSQTQESPAFQAAFDYAHEAGFYAGVWGSSVDFIPDDALPEEEDDADLEIDVYVGWSFAITDDFSADVQLVRYIYPSTNDGFDYDYNEFIGKLGWSWLTFSLGYSNDVFNLDESGIYYNVGGEWELPAEITLSAGVGYYDLDDALGDSYADYSLAVSKSWGKFNFSLGLYDTSGGGDDLYGTLADDRAVATVSLALP
jgi:uncharacterized protein (TIGR02001 family)